MKHLKNIVNWFKRFFNNDSIESMMRLLSFILVVSGIILTYICLLLSLDGAYYGIELVVIGIMGKGYQKRKELEHG